MQDFYNYAMSTFVVSPKKPLKALKPQNQLALPVEDSQEATTHSKELRSVTSTEIKQFKTVFIDGLAPK